MACFHPLKAIKRKDSNTYKIMKFSRDGADWNSYVDTSTGEYQEQILLPCGRCVGCRMDHSKEWANRCVLESLSHPLETNWFLTLTIDDDHLPSYFVDSGLASVRADDITTFMKALRGHWSYKYHADGIRFFGVTEYGDKSFRPHYHILVFGLPLFDLVHYKNNERGDAMWISKELEDVWQKGLIVVGEFNWNSAAYTARYCMKKIDGFSPAFYADLGIEKEITRMSRKPGIGVPYFDAHVDQIYDLDEIVLPATTGNNLQVISPPKIFDKKYGEQDLLALSKIKWDRQRVANIRQQAVSQMHGYDPYEYLEIQERSLLERAKKFCRST